MNDPRPLVFQEDWAEILFDGVPLVEYVLEAFVGRCQACGCRAERQHDGSVLANVLVVEGTLYGDTYCVDCFDGGDEPDEFVFVLPPLE